MSLAAQFDSVRSLRQAKGDNFLIGAHQNATPVFIATMSLAGVDFFQTDYPLELALQGLALKLESDPNQFAEDLNKAKLMEHC